MGAPTSAAAFRNNEVVRETIYVTDAAGAAVTGLVNANFNKFLILNGATNATTVTVTEVANGHYTVEFTPTSVGHWSSRVNHATYGDWLASWNIYASDLGALDFMDVTAIPASNTADTLLDKVNFLEEAAGEGNRKTITYNGDGVPSTVSHEFSQDAFATIHRTRTQTVTYPAATPTRPSISSES